MADSENGWREIKSEIERENMEERLRLPISSPVVI